MKAMKNIPGTPEYPSIMSLAAREGWLLPLLDAHLTPCDTDTASSMIETLRRRYLLGEFLSLKFKGSEKKSYRGRAKLKRSKYAIILPRIPAPKAEHLRIGLVLHEFAHVLDRYRRRNDAPVLKWTRRKVGAQRYRVVVVKPNGKLSSSIVSRGGRWVRVQREVGPKMNHGPAFCATLKELVLEWIKEGGRMPVCSDYRAVYARHQGPFSVVAVRPKPNKKDATAVSYERVKGPSMSAEDAHELSRSLVEDTRDPVLRCLVFSDSESCFMGAYYERGQVIPAWYEFATDVAAEF